MNLVEHAQNELDLLGEEGSFANSLISAIEGFTSFGHSGASAEIAIEMLTRLLKYENLTPLTNNPAEWIDRSEISGYSFWQNKRNTKAFSENGGLTYRILGEVPEGGNLSDAPEHTSVDCDKTRR